MKIAPIYAEMRRRSDAFDVKIVHTGQHYDAAMSEAFFTDLGMPEPDIHLGVGSGSHAAQTAKIMTEFEPVVLKTQPDWVLVVGDVNSTIACALVCSKLGVKVAHVEAGLRSRDRSMPEEINRILTDAISDLLLTTSKDADENLKSEGIDDGKIRFVGNVMIDSLMEHLKLAEQSKIRKDLGVDGREYAVATLHRPSNVDDAETLTGILGALADPSANACEYRAVWTEQKDRGFADRADRAARLSRFHAALQRCSIGHDRLGRSAGRDNRSRNSLPHPPPQHRAAGHDRARNKCPRR
jgi:UDP-N-acetylglucosamine 2-epimerase (non-hydrolysing)